VSGSGDDHESWSLGLTPSLYWSHRLEILSADRASLSSVVERVVASGSTSCDQEPNVLDPPSSRMRLDLGPLASLPETLHGPTLVLAIDESTTPTPSERLHMLDVSPGKRGHSALIAQLDEALRFAGVYFATGETLHIRYLDSELKDAAAALALALLGELRSACI
jgi:tRNA A64-2'-O-ribosylphosphate transferase